ncbi:long-chain fatty acid--CoA ligase [Spongiactinospora gelatinilytica]|uniref:Long-chain fatty acid--CoA ligase n=1 Tax=Spongiactinospora gelatinilytica TaxID=2666298 RepID=A0A2W2HQG2_9ACTN|nr:acyl-CoA synthetase [Spongiactinospora gelatinilytica]PZG52018.1 long-chain fatty acid--CoA ligase [Spongiactinospora gelatinilytica]
MIDRPLVLVPEDLAAVEAVPLAARDLPASTYELLVRSAAAYGGSPALHLIAEGGGSWRLPRTWTFADLLGHVHRAANLYHAFGLRPGGVVGLLAPNTGGAYAALLGAQAIGVAAPVNPLLGEDHLAGLLELAGAEILVAAGPELAPAVWEKAVRLTERLPRVRALLALGGDFEARAAEQPADALTFGYRPGPEDVAAYFHTGGTTGVPRIAPHTHLNEVYTAWAMGCTGAFLEGAVVLGGLPLFHVNALHVTGLAPTMHGTPVVSLGPLGFRDPELMPDFWRIVDHYQVTSFSAVPTVYQALPPVPEDAVPSSLRAGVVGAAPLPRGVREAFESTAKVPLVEGYGLTEGTCATSVMPVFGRRAGSVGLRLAYQRVKAVKVDDAGRPVADCEPGEPGVLAIEGPNVFPGYLRPGPHGAAPDPTGIVFDGWLLTGDLGHVDADGYVHLAGRAKDLIIRGGHNISPEPVEEALLAHPDVTAAAVVGRPDAHAGEVPVAYVTLTPGAATAVEDLLAWAAGRAPEPAAAPKAVYVVESLPVTAVGKVFKPALREDAVRRVVLALLGRAGIGGTVETVTRDGVPHADITVTGDAASLVPELRRHTFTHTLRGAHE